jgi:hypothetical protein
MFYHKAAVWGALVLKSGFQCLIETFISIKHLRFYAPLRIPYKRNAAKPCLQHGFLLVKFWNCQSHITCEIFN